MIKLYTTKPLLEHDADYPWYRPGHIPSNTCHYPYHFPYFNAYPTYTVTTDLHLKKDSPKRRKGKNRLVQNALILLTILVFIYLVAKLAF